MAKNLPLKRIPFILFILSSLSAIISEFIPWSMHLSAFSFISIFGWSFSTLFYFFPLFSGIFIMVGCMILQFSKKINKIITYIIILFGMNLPLIFLFEMIDMAGIYIFNYPGVYSLIICIVLLLFGLIYQLSSPVNNYEDMEQI